MRTGWAADELNGALNLLPARSEGYVFGVPAATLLGGFRPHFAEFDGCRVRWFERGEGSPCSSYTVWEVLRELDGVGGAPCLGAQGDRPDLRGTERPAGPERRPARLVCGRPGRAARPNRGGACGGRRALDGRSRSARLAACRPDAVAALVVVESAGIVSLTRRAAIFLAVSAALKPARRVARFRKRIAGSDSLKRLAFGYWGAHDPASLSPESVLGWLASTRQHSDTATAERRSSSMIRATTSSGSRARRSSSGAPATGSSRSRTASSSRGACGRRSASSRVPDIW